MASWTKQLNVWVGTILKDTNDHINRNQSDKNHGLKTADFLIIQHMFASNLKNDRSHYIVPTQTMHYCKDISRRPGTVNQWKNSSDPPIKYGYNDGIIYLYKHLYIPGGVGFLSIIETYNKLSSISVAQLPGSLKLLENHMFGPSCLNYCGFRYSMCVV